MIKNSKLSNELIVLQKIRKQGIRFWDEKTFWHEIIYKSLIPTFGKPKWGLNFYKLSHARMFSRPKILFLVSLIFVALLNSYLLNFIILVCLLFIHAKHS